MDAKHTPPPWDVEGDGIYSGNNRVAKFCTDEDANFAARAVNAHGDFMAMAELIIGAPFKDRHKKIDALARAALAKARGE